MSTNNLNYLTSILNDTLTGQLIREHPNVNKPIRTTGINYAVSVLNEINNQVVNDDLRGDLETVYNKEFLDKFFIGLKTPTIINYDDLEKIMINNLIGQLWAKYPTMKMIEGKLGVNYLVTMLKKIDDQNVWAEIDDNLSARFGKTFANKILLGLRSK